MYKVENINFKIELESKQKEPDVKQYSTYITHASFKLRQSPMFNYYKQF